MKILLAEDDEVSRYVVSETLRRWGYEVVCAADGEQAWDLLQSQNAPQLALLDWVMPGLDGVEVCRRVRDRGSEPYVYILLLTSKGQKQDVIQGMSAGADDYITKPCDPQELQTRLSAGHRIIKLQTELLEARESLRYLALHDSLTGLVNRNEVLERLKSETDRSSRDGSSVGVLLVDIDHFKLVNDRYGHADGDQVLVEVASRMRSTLRSYDIVGRYGGEEFLVILPGCDSLKAELQAERLREAIAGKTVSLSQGLITVTVSIGVMAKDSGSNDSPSQLIGAADAALYRAKAAGRNRVVLAAGIADTTAYRSASSARPLNSADHTLIL